MLDFSLRCNSAQYDSGDSSPLSLHEGRRDRLRIIRANSDPLTSPHLARNLHRLHIVLEYAEGGDLYHLIDVQRAKRLYFKESQLWRYLHELCLALQYLHGKKIIHRDIKTLNVFLTGANMVKLGDLGVSRVVKDDDLMETRVGTPLYLPPELVKKQPYGFKADIWSLGCLMYSLAKLQPPFSGDNIYALACAIVRAEPKPLPAGYTNRIRMTIMKMLNKNPAARPSIEGIIAMIPQVFKAKGAGGEGGGGGAEGGK